MIASLCDNLMGSSKSKKAVKRWAVTKGGIVVSTHTTKKLALKAAKKVRGRVVKYKKGMKKGSFVRRVKRYASKRFSSYRKPTRRVKRRVKRRFRRW